MSKNPIKEKLIRLPTFSLVFRCAQCNQWLRVQIDWNPIIKEIKISKHKIGDDE